jgi:hypothetical protein
MADRCVADNHRERPALGACRGGDLGTRAGSSRCPHDPVLHDAGDHRPTGGHADQPLAKIEPSASGPPAAEIHPRSISVGGLRDEFWATPASPAADPPAANGSPLEPLACIRLPITAGVALEIAGASAKNITAESSAELRPALENLLRDLRRLGWIAGPHELPADTPSSSTSSGEPQ